MKLIELKQLIADKLGIALSTICAEDFKAYGVRFHYLGSSYRATTDLTVETVDGGCLVTDDDARQIEKLLRVEEWDGEGLPTVGCEFEYQSSNGWVTASMKFCGRSFAIVEAGGLETWLSLSANIRPVRSEADQKREEVETALRTCLAGTGAGITPLAAKCIYDSILNKEIPHIRID